MSSSISHHQLARQLIDMLEERTALRPRVAMLLGSGHASIANQLKDKVVIPGEDIPGQALQSPILVGILEGVPVAVADAPLASYEGLSASDLAYPVRVLKALGCELLILTAGAASLSQQIERGSIAVVEDHINLSGIHPLVGPNDDQLGPRFPDMSEPYHRKWLEISRKVAIDAGVPCSPVHDLGELTAHPHTAASGMLLEYDVAPRGPLKGVAQPLRFNGQRQAQTLPPPQLGQHSVEVLAEAGFSAEEIEAFVSAGVIGVSD